MAHEDDPLFPRRRFLPLLLKTPFTLDDGSSVEEKAKCGGHFWTYPRPSSFLKKCFSPPPAVEEELFSGGRTRTCQVRGRKVEGNDIFP